MERKNQNSEFPKKSSAKSEECLERRSAKLLSTRPLCASGGDAAVPENPPCNSKTSSRHSLGYGADKCEQNSAGVERSEEGELMRHFQCDVTDILEAAKQNFGAAEDGSYTFDDIGSRLKSELSKYKKELKEYNSTTKNLEEKYMKINHELSAMQQKHDRFVASRKSSAHDSETYSDSSSTGSEYSLRRKYTQVFHRGSSFMTMLPPESSSENLRRNLSRVPECDLHPRGRTRKSQRSDACLRSHSPHQDGVYYKRHRKHSKRQSENKENEPPHEAGSTHSRSQANGLKDIYNVLRNVLDSNHKPAAGPKGFDPKELQATISSLQSEQAEFRSIIQQQQNCMQEYYSRCVKAQKVMQTQQHEIEKLNCNNEELENGISAGIEQLRAKIDNKLRDVSHLPQLMREERTKYEKAVKENSALTDRVNALQSESSQLKQKMEELGRRKVVTITRLKAAERDLKIFKNYNTALKHEKRKLGEELQKLKEQLETVQSSSKKTLTRQREQSEKQRRELQKRVFELELKLGRSHNSTTSLIQERDSLIAELQTQLNTLVHNFEVSQKHIRVLRRHIYSMSGGSVRSNSRLNEAV